MATDRRSRESGGPAAFAMSEEQWDSRFRGNDELGKPMIGDGCRAQPFSEEQREALRTACAEDGEIWQIYANNFGPDGFDASIDRYISNRGNRTFVLFDGDELAGMSSYLGIDPNRQVLEIGGTYYAPEHRGGPTNPAAKRLLLGEAFARGARRVQFKVDAINARSRAAVLKLCAVQEGILRQDRVCWTGRIRDTVFFSILANEWPGVRARLDARLLEFA